MIYKRDKSFPETVGDLAQEVKDIKSLQRVGNDNLVVRYYEDSLTGISVAEDETALFRGTFVFNNPSNSYAPIFFSWTSLDFFFYVETIYDDPNTATSTTMKRAFIAITPDASMNMYIRASCKSTEQGTFVLEKL